MQATGQTDPADPSSLRWFRILWGLEPERAVNTDKTVIKATVLAVVNNPPNLQHQLFRTRSLRSKHAKLHLHNSIPGSRCHVLMAASGIGTLALLSPSHLPKGMSAGEP